MTFLEPTPTPAPEAPKRRRGLVLPIVGAALVGAGVSAAAVGAVESGDKTTTVTTTTSRGFAATPVANTSSSTTASTSSGGAKSIQQIYRDTKDGVVRVEQQNGQGSGFVVSDDGYILTNAHVVDGGGEIYVSFSNKDRERARVVGVDNGTDIALLKVSVKFALRPIPLGHSDTVQVGDAVVAIGNPFGLDRTVTSGIVSALGRSITSPNGFNLNNALQTDAAINHGNSGGPLLNDRGEVIGINAQIADSGVNANVGVGFAIPVDTAREVADELKADGKAEHAYLGVSMTPVDSTLAQRSNLAVNSGAMVGEVRPGGPAERAGLRGSSSTLRVGGTQYAVGGDIIVGIDGQAVHAPEDLQNVIAEKKPGDKITLDVRRNNGRDGVKVQITLGEQPQTVQQEQPSQSPDPFPTP